LKSYYPIAIGTPNRLHKLVEVNALSLERTQLILVDMKQNEKNFNIITLPDTKADFYTFLSQDIIPHRNHLKISLI